MPRGSGTLPANGAVSLGRNGNRCGWSSPRAGRDRGGRPAALRRDWSTRANCRRGARVRFPLAVPTDCGLRFGRSTRPRTNRYTSTRRFQPCRTASSDWAGRFQREPGPWIRRAPDLPVDTSPASRWPTVCRRARDLVPRDTGNRSTRRGRRIRTRLRSAAVCPTRRQKRWRRTMRHVPGVVFFADQRIYRPTRMSPAGAAYLLPGTFGTVENQRVAASLGRGFVPRVFNELFELLVGNVVCVEPETLERHLMHGPLVALRGIGTSHREIPTGSWTMPPAVRIATGGALVGASAENSQCRMPHITDPGNTTSAVKNSRLFRRNM